MLSAKAEPYEFQFDPKTTALVMIDFQRDFVYPGGFGESLGNDTSFLLKALPAAERVLKACRAAGLFIIHTREGHRADLSDLPAAKYERGRPKIHIGDEGPMGRLLVRGEHGHDIVDEVYPIAGEPIVDKPGKGAFYATDMDTILKTRGIRQLVVCGVTTEVCVQTSVREANDRGYDAARPGGRRRLVLPRVPEVGPRHDQGAGRHLRLRRDIGGLPRGPWLSSFRTP